MVAQRKNNAIKIRTIDRETAGICIQMGLFPAAALPPAPGSSFCSSLTATAASKRERKQSQKISAPAKKYLKNTRSADTITVVGWTPAQSVRPSDKALVSEKIGPGP